MHRRKVLWLAAMPVLLSAPAGAQPTPFAGVWRAATVIQGVACTVDLVMMNNGSFQQQTRTQGGVIITIMGVYRVFAEQNVLRLDIQNYEPKQWCGPLGCTPIRIPSGETHHFQFGGPNALTLQIASGGNPIRYQRIQ